MNRVLGYSVRATFGLILIIVFWSCAGIPGVKDESVTPIIRVPFVRVLLVENEPSVLIESDGAFAIECLQGGSQAVFYSGQDVTVKMVGPRLRVENNRGDLIQEDLDEVNFIPRGTSSHVRFNKKTYRGILKAVPYGSNVRIVNVLYMEDYLRGVVPPEIGDRNETEIEAIKAQAVAARTYAIKHLQQYGQEPYDMKPTVVDQLYEGMNVENQLVNSAIDQTTGDIIMFEDAFINAYYHSTCGGMTDDISHVWEKPAAPYLKPVPDSASCSWSKYYTWREEFTEPQLRGRLEQYLSGDRGRQIKLAPITDLKVEERTAGGRVAKLLIRTETDNHRFFKDRIRWAIGRNSNPDLILQSDRFDVELIRDSQDKIARIAFVGGGYGHGVGMCQCGAIGKSRVGWTFDNILKHYYTGVEVKKLY
ncbi:MAG: SpoIID/LytB domain-containing protein [bacterium]|nr:SpoIID/LytB domain-containing protein [bacterium]